jgi:hypothetical protein
MLIYGTIILALFYGCEFFSLKQECCMRVCDNKMLRTTFGPKTRELAGACIHEL